MNPDHAPFLADILANPYDDGPRLVFADWLEERGDPLGEFIRVQCERAAWQNLATLPASDMERSNELHRRARVVKQLAGREMDWMRAHAWKMFRDEILSKAFQWHLSSDGSNPVVSKRDDGKRDDGLALTFHRGFIAVVHCTLEQWVGGECRRCQSQGWESVYERGEYGPDRYQQTCPTCHGTGRTTGIGPELVSQWPIERVKFEAERYVLRSQLPASFDQAAGLPFNPLTWARAEAQRLGLGVYKKEVTGE
jgi:uncharacterized protein (TIGR02996 family)